MLRITLNSMRSTPKSATSNKTNMIDARSDASNYIWFPTSNELVSLTRVRRKKPLWVHWCQNMFLLMNPTNISLSTRHRRTRRPERKAENEPKFIGFGSTATCFVQRKGIPACKLQNTWTTLCYSSSSTDIKAARFRAGQTHTACATIYDAVCFKRFTKVLPWSCLEQDVENATWQIVSGTAACGCHLEIRFGSRDKREDSVRFKQMIASGWEELWARWRDRLWENCAKCELTTAYCWLVSTKMNRFSRGLHSLTPNRPKSGLCIDIMPCYVDHLTAWILLPLSLHGDLDEGRK